MIRKRAKPTTTCPFLQSIGRASPEPVGHPDYLHRCTANEQQRQVTPQTQAFFCLHQRHTTCPFFTPTSSERAPAEAREGAS